MKKVILSVLAIVCITVISCKNETKTETPTTTVEGKELAMANFGVRGNCGMCKATIEKAAKAVDGVAEATWDVKKKSIAVSYDASKANEKDLHKAIAAAGYDTEQTSGDKTAYDKLPKCCKFDDNQKMNQ
ncbi:heavy-metal-associated domain-containing protein [uncultured Kordia sp.]|uniref:heavy-metal-associated domain-containing protein n=1 Tax=uncultured Kordia sp. TaxID=507699 RepID=UPI00260A0A61|nr:heavy-metal-associated domain-containing protein [uncultured Kordia sp.]